MNNPITLAFRRLLIALPLLFVLTGCGGGDGPDDSEVEGPYSKIVLTHTLEPGGLQAQGDVIRMKAAVAELSRDLSQYSVHVNRAIVTEAQLHLNADVLTIRAHLLEGKNEIFVIAPDANGALINADFEIWAGTAMVAGQVIDASGNPVAGAEVVATLGDDQRVKATTTTDTAGNYQLRNFPARTVMVSVTGPTGLPGITSGVAGGLFSDVVLRPFGTPVSVNNNDFHLGTEGWISHDGVPLTLTPHIENPGPATPADIVRNTHATEARQDSPYEAAALTVNTSDLVLATQGHGKRTASYTFNPPVMAQSVRIRYRFQTAEYPTYYGSKYNDSFSVALRSQGGKSLAESGTLNGLSRAAFDATGSTAWRELSTPLTARGEPVEIRLSIANVGDHKYQSKIVVDIVDTTPLSIASAKVFDIDNAPLTFLSASTHGYFGGHTRVHANFQVNGSAEATLKALELQVLQGGVVKARGTLRDALASTLYRKFDGQPIALNDAQLAFEIPAGELVNIQTDTDGVLALKLVATTDTNEHADYDLGRFPLLSHWTGTDRYGARDETRGGDDWATPLTNDVCKTVKVTWGDFSNMNGGSFAPDHATHRLGKDIDGWYPGYQNRDAAAATKMLELLNAPGTSGKVKSVLVTHKASAGNAFYDVYKDQILADGRAAKSIIRNHPGHNTHFHWALY